MKSKSIERHLAAMWSAPEGLPAGKFAGQPLFCAASTYTFNADFFESDLLPRFLGLRFDDSEGSRPFIVEREEALRCCRVSLLVDGSKADGSQTTLRWDQIPVFVPGGVQHAKVTLLMWESCVRLIVASANVTRNGYRRNREIAGVLDFFNHQDSAPREVLYDAIAFLEGLTFWSRADSRVLARLRDGLRLARDRVGQWTLAPRDFSERERPKVSFVSGYPRRDGALSSSVMKRLVNGWGHTSAKQITVLTPFLGQPDSNYSELIHALREIPLARDVTGCLLLPRRSEIDEDDTTPRIGLPGRFRDEWAKAWGVEPGEVETFGIPPIREEAGEKILRELHAKAILIENDSKTMLMCGSSNFSAHGMGINVFNTEANLVYTENPTDGFDGIGLKDRLPVDWDNDRVVDAIWDDEGVSFEDDIEPHEPNLPNVFQSATFRQTAAVITLGFKEGAAFPSHWEMSIPGERLENGLTIISGRELGPCAPAELVVDLPEHLQRVHLIYLRVSWRDEEGVERSARLLVHVLNQEDLFPPPEFVGMTVNTIVDCLIAGKELSDISNEREKTGQETPQPDNPTPIHDTKDYLLYRMRRLGHALGVLGDRVLKAARTKDAVSYRLMCDPLGPVQLAEALVREHQSHESVEGEVEAALFALQEICLVVAYAGASLHSKREAGESDFRALFQGCIKHLDEKAECISTGRSVEMGVLAYGKKIGRKTKQLLTQ